VVGEGGLTVENQQTSTDETSIVRPGANGGGAALTRVGFGQTEIETKRETQGAALAERAKAEVQARYIMALQRPRSLADVRVRLLDHCRRPGFAEAAEYAKPVGGGTIRGASIRFVETALQEYGNVLPDATVTYDDDEKRIIRVSLTDLERNITYNEDALIEKFVERSNPRDGDEILGQRTNSRGRITYRVRATEDDFANKAAAAASKKLRNLGLRILPADLVDEAMWTCGQTRKDRDAKNPGEAQRVIADNFAALRVMPADLAAFLGHPFEQTSPAELDDLRAAYAAVRGGEARWVDLVEAKRVERGELEEASKPAAAAASKLKEKLDAKKAQQAKGEQQTMPTGKPEGESK
jgi:translation initiation factor IF-1